VRILSLDGGGVRGIIELTILQSIIDKVGHNIPIQELFDLAVGTSTGGIIALGLFRRQWSINEASELFACLAKEAFQARSGLKIWWDLPLARLTRQITCDYVYKSSGIESALKNAFGNESKLFGYFGQSAANAVKVGVVAVGDEDQRAYLLTNYNREWRVNDDENNDLRREEEPDDELAIWEAARCTSAAPTYFEKFKHGATNRIYTDGAMERNNPVSMADNERKFIWPDSSHHARDIILSIGTGYAAEFGGKARKSQSADTLKSLSQFGLVAKIALMRLVIENTLDCQKMWHVFKKSLGLDSRLLSKCHRINVPLGPGLRPCEMDDVDEMEAMKKEAEAFVEQRSQNVAQTVQDEFSAKIERIARQLVASLFYLEVQHLNVLPHDEIRCQGRIYCRLSESCVPQFRSLTQKNPTFRIQEDSKYQYHSVNLIGAWDTRLLFIQCSFGFAKGCSDVAMEMSVDNGKNWEDISGFPCNLKTPYLEEDRHTLSQSVELPSDKALGL